MRLVGGVGGGLGGESKAKAKGRRRKGKKERTRFVLNSWFKISVVTVYLYRIAGNFRVVQNFAVFTDRSASAKIAASAISIAPHLPVRADARKIKTAKFLLDSTKFCTR